MQPREPSEILVVHPTLPPHLRQQIDRRRGNFFGVEAFHRRTMQTPDCADDLTKVCHRGVKELVSLWPAATFRKQRLSFPMKLIVRLIHTLLVLCIATVSTRAEFTLDITPVAPGTGAITFTLEQDFFYSVESSSDLTAFTPMSGWMLGDGSEVTWPSTIPPARPQAAPPQP